jgi:hypothetical protein
MLEWSDDTTKRRLALLCDEVAQKRPMALFLGSGVARGWGLPLWDEMCSGVLGRALEKRDGNKSTREQAASLARLYTQMYFDGPLAVMQYAGDLLGAEFAEVVRTVLYEHRIDATREQSALETVSRAIAGEQVLREIVTYNYDDLLERILIDERGMNVHAVTCGEELGALDRSRNDVLMYYVHGRVPSRPGDSTSASVVATEGEYHELRQRELDWRNLIQLQILTTTRALFIGLSLNDPNLRWLMKTCYQETHRRHYAVDVAESPAHLRERIERITGADCGAETATALTNLRMDAREHLGQHFGIDFLWIRDWSELPTLIESVFKLTGH